MDYIYDAPFSAEFRCNGDLDFHDYYYVSPLVVDEASYLYRVHRTGIEHTLPRVLEVARDSSTKFCEIFCILSGCGYLDYRGKIYTLHRNQLVLLAANEPHRYWSDSDDPMGKAWLEIYGGDADKIISRLIELNGPVMEGALFPEICAQVCLIQQRLMVDKFYQPAIEIYKLLVTMLQQADAITPPALTDDNNLNFLLMEAYINAHISRKITNSELADVCGISLPHFIKQFKAHYRTTPQKYIMLQRLKKARYSLLATNLSIDSISESLGFCNTSHFIKRFLDVYGMSPSKYRKAAVFNENE